LAGIESTFCGAGAPGPAPTDCTEGPHAEASTTTSANAERDTNDPG